MPGNSHRSDVLSAAQDWQVLSIDDRHELVVGFLNEFEQARTTVDRYRVLQEWLPLLRSGHFVAYLEVAVDEFVRLSKDGFWKHLYRTALDAAKYLQTLSPENQDEYFAARSTSEQLENLAADNVGQEYYLKATAAKANGDIPAAQLFYDRAITAFDATPNLGMVGLCYLDRAELYLVSNQNETAITLLYEALSYLEHVGDVANVAACHNNLGYLSIIGGDCQKGYDHGLKGLRSLSALKINTAQLANLVDRLSMTCLNAVCGQQVHQTIRRDHFLALADVLGSMETQHYPSRCVSYIANELHGLNESETAYELIMKSIRRADRAYYGKQFMTELTALAVAIGQVSNKSLETIAADLTEALNVPSDISRLGDLLHGLVLKVRSGSLSLDEAICEITDAHLVKPFEGNAIYIIERDINRAIGLWNSQNPAPMEILSAYEIDLRIIVAFSEFLGELGIASAAMFDVALIHDMRGQLDDAIGAFRRAAELAARAGLNDFQIQMLSNIALATRRAGDVKGAIRLLSALLAQIDALDEKQRKPGVLADLARFHCEIDNCEQAESFATEGLQLIRSLDESMVSKEDRLPIESRLCTELAELFRRDHRFQAAVEQFARVCEIAKERQSVEDQAIALGDLSSLYLELRDMDRARDLCDKAYELIRFHKFSESYARIYSVRAMMCLIGGEPIEARTIAQMLVKQGISGSSLVIALEILITTAQNEGERSEAIARISVYLTSCSDPLHRVALIDRLLTNVIISEQQRNEWVDMIRVDTAAITGIPGIILNRRVAELVMGFPNGVSIAREHLKTSVRIADEIATANPSPSIRRRIYSETAATIRLLVELTEVARERLELILQTNARDTLNAIWSPIRSIAQVQKCLHHSQQRVILIEFFTLGDQEGRTSLYFVGDQGLMAVEHLHTSTSRLFAHDCIGRKLGDPVGYEAAWESEAWSAISTELGTLFARHTRPGDVLVIIPSSFWHLLPIHACTCDGLYLAIRNPVVYGPSASVLSRQGDPHRRWKKVLTVGVDFDAEAKSVADWFGGQFVGSQLAMPEAIAIRIEHEDAVHFSTHGVYEIGGEHSGLMLKNNSWLTPELLENHSTSADLICLSACETAVAFVTPGDDVIGLDVAFLNMGAVSVLGTLWPVRADATSTLIAAFYRHLTGQVSHNQKIMSKAHALQAVVIEALRDQAFKHPYFWAPFKLSGGWI